MLKEEIKNLVKKAIGNEAGDFSVDISPNKNFGDYSTNVAMVLKKNPNEIAEKIKSDLFKKIEIKNGFINFFVADKYLQNQLTEILKQKNKYGDGKKKKERINIEFISANPTGPLTLGNGRGGFCGDVLARVLSKAGYNVLKEYYINDTGNQINKLGHSVIGDDQAEYKGVYIEELRKKISAQGGPASGGKGVEVIGQEAAKEILEKMIKPSVKKMGIKFDKWFSEKILYKNKEVDEAINELKNKNFTYESEGALWFKSKDLGDDKDRVLVRADGIKTYFASDIAYLKNKFGRGFDDLIMFLGADHYGYMPRLLAAALALEYKKENIHAIVMQLVKLFEDGKEVKMSKRAGTYITIDELIDEVGLDVARFFFLMITPNTHMNFNLNLAKEKSEKNPVFKVQYAYARICSVLRKSPAFIFWPVDFKLLKDPSEISIIKKLVEFPEIVEDVAKDYQVQRLPQYAMELADEFHSFYERCHVISDDKNLTKARVSLILAVKIVLENTLKLMGVSAPENMKRNEVK